MMEPNAYVRQLKAITKYLIITLMSLLVLAMVLGSLDLLVELYKRIVSPDPISGLINVEDLYSVFSVLLIILVGYELFKSMLLILHHDQIPVKSILKIAAIAMANKVITLNIKEITFDHMIGLGVLVIAVGAAFFFFNQEKSSE